MLEWEELSFPERVALKDACERSFLNFTRIFFELLQGDKLMVNWHHRLIAERIEQVIWRHAECENLVINLPPGGTKTELISIHLPAYINMLVQIGKLRRFRNLNLSFSDSLTKRNSRRTRDIIASKEYQEFWPCSFGTNQAEEWQINDAKGKVRGETISRSMGGQIMGARGGFPGADFSGGIFEDDPDKPEDMFSSTKRDAQHRRQKNTVRSRRGDKSQEHPTPIIVVQQRLHKEDTSGFLLSGGMGIEFSQIKIPGLLSREYIESLPEPHKTRCWNCVKDTKSRTVGGVEYWSYWPEMEGVDQLVDQWEADEYGFLSQTQQEPVNITGNLIDTAWLGRYEQLPILVSRAIYVDTNSGKVNDRNDYTVFLLAGRDADGNLYAIDVERGKWDPEELLAKANELWERWKPFNHTRPAPIRYMSIEDKQAGQGLITTLKKKNAITVKDVQRGAEQNKLIRHYNVQPQIKGGKVFVPRLHLDDGTRVNEVTYWDGSHASYTGWVTPFLSELDALTAEVLLDKESGYDDQYDALMDAIDDNLIQGSSVSMWDTL